MTADDTDRDGHRRHGEPDDRLPQPSTPRPGRGRLRLFLTVLARLLPGRRTAGPGGATDRREDRTRPVTTRRSAAADALDGIDSAGRLTTAAGSGDPRGADTAVPRTGGGGSGALPQSGGGGGGGGGGALPQSGGGGGGGGGSWLDGFSL